MALDRDAVLSLLRLRDPLGVLSVYVCSTPERQAGEHPEWEIAMRSRIRDLKERTKAEGPRERWTALYERLDAVGDDLERLTDPRSPGRGRALFAPLNDGALQRFAIQMPLPDAVVLDRSAYVRPLVAALDDGRAAGILIVNRDGIRVIETRLGEAEELAAHRFERHTGDWKQGKGPAAAQPTPGLGSVGVTHRDRFEHRVDENRERFLKSKGDELRDLVARRRWDRLVVLSIGRIADPVLEPLRHPGGPDILHEEQDPEWESAHQIAQAADRILRDAQRRRQGELVEQATGAAAAGGAGSVGTRDVLAALRDGRVAHLLVAADAAGSGFRSEEGYLVVSEDEAPEGWRLAEEPRLADRMIERAFETDALVTVLDESAAQTLREHGGVAALLRW